MKTSSGVGPLPALIDTHCHLDIERYFPDCAEALRLAEHAGVHDLVMAGVDRSGWARMVSLSKRFPRLHAAPGLHPMYLHLHNRNDINELSALVDRERLVAIGEVGLDYQVQNCDRQAQQELFEVQIDIARMNRLPLLLHARKAHDQVLATLRRKRFKWGGIVHAYNGSYQQATHFVDLGFCLGVCGTITYDRANKIRRVAAQLPLDSLVLETDSPDIPTAAHWGEDNHPQYLPEILFTLARLRQQEAELIALRTTENARRVLTLA